MGLDWALNGPDVGQLELSVSDPRGLWRNLGPKLAQSRPISGPTKTTTRPSDTQLWQADSKTVLAFTFSERNCL